MSFLTCLKKLYINHSLFTKRYTYYVNKKSVFWERSACIQGLWDTNRPQETFLHDAGLIEGSFLFLSYSYSFLLLPHLPALPECLHQKCQEGALPATPAGGITRTNCANELRERIARTNYANELRKLRGQTT